MAVLTEMKTKEYFLTQKFSVWREKTSNSEIRPILVIELYLGRTKRFRWK